MSWTTYFYHCDAQGSIRVVANSSQVETDRYNYDAYGNQRSAAGATPNSVRYVGQYGYYYDLETGTFNVRARIYHSMSIRWLSADLLRYCEPESNVYRYASNGPINFIDPSGNLILDVQGECADANSILCDSPPKYAGWLSWLAGTACTANQIEEAEAYCDSKGCDLCSCFSCPELRKGFAFSCKKKNRTCRCTFRHGSDPVREGCPDRVYGEGATLGICQKAAKWTAPEPCRKYYGHCDWVR
jgi:RHS repeat-associated protein